MMPGAGDQDRLTHRGEPQGVPTFCVGARARRADGDLGSRHRRAIGLEDGPGQSAWRHRNLQGRPQTTIRGKQSSHLSGSQRAREHPCARDDQITRLARHQRKVAIGIG